MEFKVFLIILCIAGSTLAKIVKIDPFLSLDNGDTIWHSTLKKRPIEAYLGIPYAKPPLKELRFKLPQKLSDLTEPKTLYVGDNSSNIFKYSTCSQMNFFEKLDGQENCLHLNIYKPRDIVEKLPVLVWIHGGGFFAGSGSPEYVGPDHILDHDLILVTINYRLGPLGFLTLENEEMPGNLGKKNSFFKNFYSESFFRNL